MRLYLKIFLIFVLASFKVAISMAADLGQTNENIKRCAVSASKNTNALQFSEESLSESEENEEDATHPFASAAILSFSPFYDLFTSFLIAEQNRKINYIFFQKYSSDRQLFMLFKNFRI